MGLLSNTISKEKLRLGDHIYAYRNWHAYSHHGIYVGVDEVIHFTAGSDIITSELESESESGSQSTGKCDKCGYDPNKCPEGVVKTCVDCFLKGHHLLLFHYGVSALQFNLKIKGSCSTDACVAPDVTVKLASDIFLKNQGFGKYVLLENNCENFAAYRKRGRPVSEQALQMISFVRWIASFLGPKFMTFIASKMNTTSRLSILSEVTRRKIRHLAECVAKYDLI